MYLTETRQLRKIKATSDPEQVALKLGINILT